MIIRITLCIAAGLLLGAGAIAVLEAMREPYPGLDAHRRGLRVAR